MKSLLRPSLALSLLSLPLMTARGDTVSTNNSTVVAHSTYEYTNSQGFHNWSYGYYDRTADGNATYDAADFQALPVSGGGFAVGGNPPWTSISNGLDAHPNGTNSGNEQWVIRRYTVEPGASGTLNVNWFGSKSNTFCGDGVVVSLYRNGVAVDSAQTVAFNDGVGFNRTVNIVASVGDVIDVVLAPNGGGDPCDGSRFGMGVLQNNAVSFTTNGPAFANSVTDFGQNTNGWTYGYYDITANGAPDAGGGDFIAFSGASWNGSYWDLASPAAPWTEVTAVGGHPNGTNNGAEQWATRRYTIQPGEAGDIVVDWDLAKGNPAGNGTGVHILKNGVEVDYRAVAGDDTAGVHRAILVPGAQVGDVIDIALDPKGLGSYLGVGGYTDDGADSSTFSARLYLAAVPEPGVGALAGVALAGLLRRRRRA